MPFAKSSEMRFAQAIFCGAFFAYALHPMMGTKSTHTGLVITSVTRAEFGLRKMILTQTVMIIFHSPFFASFLFAFFGFGWQVSPAKEFVTLAGPRTPFLRTCVPFSMTRAKS